MAGRSLAERCHMAELLAIGGGPTEAPVAIQPNAPTITAPTIEQPPAPESPAIPAEGQKQAAQQQQQQEAPQLPTGAYLDGDHVVIPFKDGSGRFTKVALSELPTVWQTQHANYSELSRQNAILEARLEMAQGQNQSPQSPQTQQQQQEPDTVTLVRQALQEEGLEDDLPFAKVIGRVVDTIAGKTVTTLTAAQAKERFDSWNAAYTELATADPSFNYARPENEAARMVMDWAKQNNIPPERAYKRFLLVTGRTAPAAAAPVLNPNLQGQIQTRTQQQANAGAALTGANGTGASPTGQRRTAYPAHVMEAVNHYKETNPGATPEDLQWIANYTLQNTPAPGGN